MGPCVATLGLQNYTISLPSIHRTAWTWTPGPDWGHLSLRIGGPCTLGEAPHTIGSTTQQHSLPCSAPFALDQVSHFMVAAKAAWV